METMRDCALLDERVRDLAEKRESPEHITELRDGPSSHATLSWKVELHG